MMALRDMEFKILFKSTRNTKIPLYFHTRKINQETGIISLKEEENAL